MLEMGTGACASVASSGCSSGPTLAASAPSTPPRCYGTEPGFKKWFEQSPEVRKEIVLVTKDNPKAPEGHAGDARQAARGPGHRLG